MHYFVYVTITLTVSYYHEESCGTKVSKVNARQVLLCGPDCVWPRVITDHNSDMRT